MSKQIIIAQVKNGFVISCADENDKGVTFIAADGKGVVDAVADMLEVPLYDQSIQDSQVDQAPRRDDKGTLGSSLGPIRR